MYSWFDHDKDGWPIMVQIELNSWTTRQQRTRVPTSDSERGRKGCISRECRRNHGGYSMMDAAVLLYIVCVYEINCTCIGTWVYFVYLCESDEYERLNLYVLCLYVFATYEPCV